VRAGPAGGAPEASPAEVAEVLTGTGMTVAVAESITGGMIGSLITEQPGSSAYFAGGVIAYSNDVKRQQLDVSAALLESVGAVSREVGEAMARGVRSRLGTSLGLAVTGIAGPAAEGTSKPVGLTYVAVVSDGHVASREFTFSGDRASIRRQAATEALRMLVAEVRRIRQTGVKTA
jgi:PncC family amidohydrolase